MTTTDAINEALLGRLIDRLTDEVKNLGQGEILGTATGKALRTNKLLLKFGSPTQVHDVCLALAQHGPDQDVNWVAGNMAKVKAIVDPNAPQDEDDDEDDEFGD